MERLKLNKDYEELILKHEFKYFLENHLENKESNSNYTKENIQQIYASYERQRVLIKSELAKNKEQYRLWLYSAITHMFNGGVLPALFELNADVKDHTILDFEQYGINWAYFEAWQKWQRNRLRWRKTWDIVVKVGTVLAFILSFIKLTELFS